MARKGNSDLIDLEGTIKVDRDKSILFDDGSTEAWLPKSLIEIHQEPSKKLVTVVCPEWLAIERGLM